MKCPRCDFNTVANSLECDRCGFELPKTQKISEPVEIKKSSFSLNFFNKKKNISEPVEKKPCFDDVINILEHHVRQEIENERKAERLSKLANPFEIKKAAPKKEPATTQATTIQPGPTPPEPIINKNLESIDNITATEELNLEIESITVIEQTATQNAPTPMEVLPESDSLLSMLDFGNSKEKQPEPVASANELTEQNIGQQEIVVEQPRVETEATDFEKIQEASKTLELGQELKVEEPNLDALLKTIAAETKENTEKSTLELDLEKELGRELEPREVDLVAKENESIDLELETLTQEKEEKCYELEEDNTDLDSLLQELENGLNK